MLWENISPIKITKNGTAEFNSYTWAYNYHILTVDFPYGAGYSRAMNYKNKSNTTIEATSYLYSFLQQLNTKYPKLFSRDFYIFGESYGGHWIPGIAYKILMENNANNTNIHKLPLKGIALGDPWIDPPTQSQYYAEYAYNTGIINQYQRSIVKNIEKGVIANINSKNPQEALAYWEQSYGIIVEAAGGINVYNMRDYNTNYDMSGITKWLNSQSVKELLHIPQSINWVECDNEVYNAFTADIMSTTKTYLPYIVDSIRLMVYNAQDDLIVNTPGTEAMIASMDWSGINDFLQSPRSIWRVNGSVAGYGMRSGNMNFVLILNAGHMSPHDQPVNARDMVYRFINNLGWN